MTHLATTMTWIHLTIPLLHKRHSLLSHITWLPVLLVVSSLGLEVLEVGLCLLQSLGLGILFKEVQVVQFFLHGTVFTLVGMMRKRAALYSLQDDASACLFSSSVRPDSGNSVAGGVTGFVAAIAFLCCMYRP